MYKRQYILSQINDNHNYIQIHSDSQAAIRAIRKTEIKSQLVLDTIQIWEIIANRFNSVTLSWIKAHAGHEGKELADTQAKLGAARERINATTMTPWGTVKTTIS